MNDKVSKLLQELKSNGYTYSDINDIYTQQILEPNAVEIILKWLPSIYDYHLGSGEHLSRSLISAKKEFNPDVLIELFENSMYNKTIKSTIAHVLSVSPTYDISNWIKDQLINKEYAFERSGLLVGLATKANILHLDEFRSILKRIFDKYWWFETYLKFAKKYFIKEDIPFLEMKIKNADKKQMNEITKVIGAILKRKKSSKFPIAQLKRSTKMPINLFVIRINKQ